MASAIVMVSARLPTIASVLSGARLGTIQMSYQVQLCSQSKSHVKCKTPMIASSLYIKTLPTIASVLSGATLPNTYTYAVSTKAYQ